ncbi:GspE/PulE/PilB domain-containing protein [Stratiformator vulcanicus]|uniref:Bacteriophage N4 adsorption protein B n=1 Tax=Stratiformator vulcanicus TaxID=2527980 RepID=A0A517R399_9PLAN|nr:general secretion pathway protein GspE [Stratiformator vulcanicus]QDT38341.1 bacteriophage N4 adsorption protein B [Stratiformator vulcanicus]
MSTTSSEPNVYRDWLGIPEADLPPNYYALLRLVKFEDDEQKIRGNYRKLNEHVRGYATGKYAQKSQDLLNELAKAMLCLTDEARKREYDESLGREFDDADILGRKPMGRWLVERKVITKEKLKEAEHYAEQRGLTLRDAMVQMKLVKPAIATRALAQELGMSFVDLAEALPEADILDKLPRKTVRRHSTMPLFEDEGVLLVACLDQLPTQLEEELQLIYGLPIRPVLTTPSAMNKAISKYYPPGTREGEGGDGQSGSNRNQAGVRWKDLTDEERGERRMTGIIALCWGIVGSVLLDTFVVAKFFPEWDASSIPVFLLTFLVPPGIFLWLRTSYWK